MYEVKKFFVCILLHYKVLISLGSVGTNVNLNETDFMLIPQRFKSLKIVLVCPLLSSNVKELIKSAILYLFLRPFIQFC